MNTEETQSLPENTPIVLELAASPSGRLHLEPVSAQTDLPDRTTATRIIAAFAHNAHEGLLHLGAAEIDSTLSPSLTFGRDLARLFMTRLCAVPDLTEQWDKVEIPPAQDLVQLLQGIPPMTGAEYLDISALEQLWIGLLAAAQAGIAAMNGDVPAWLKQQHPSWSLVGRVCFHLAENKNSDTTPFAFLATYAHGLGVTGARHIPLGRALQSYAGASDRTTLLGLLLPVQRAAEQSVWFKELVNAGTIFQPVAWTPSEAYQFLHNVPLFEACGIVVRIPNWWKSRKAPRPQIQIRVGNKASGLGFNALLDFNVALTLDGETLSEDEWHQIRAAGSGLVRMKGRWIEVDQEKLDTVLTHWENIQKNHQHKGISFLDGMRLLSGAILEEPNHVSVPSATPEWSTVIAGHWLQETLDGLRSSGDIDPGPALKAQLRPYQREGVRWLWWLAHLRLGGCLADDMGLGKTVQILSLLLLAKNEGDTGPHLLVMPASLIANWQAEITRFAPSLSTFIAHPSAIPRAELTNLSADRIAGINVVITSYGTLVRLSGLKDIDWSLVVLDEAQAIKNPGTQQTLVVKALKSTVRFALTGTPIENRLGDLWSLFDFICPGLLGSEKVFSRFARRLAEDEHHGYTPLRTLIRPYILRRLKSDKSVIADLPDKTELKAYCTLTPVQASLYQDAVTELTQILNELDGIARRGAVLAFLLRFKQICNHPSQWLGDGTYASNESGKFMRLAELVEAIALRQEKVLVFTQFQEMTAPLAAFLKKIFKREGLILHGGTPVKQRKTLVDRFQDEDGPPFFVLSLKAGGSGLNLTAASHVVHFDRWWNPAVENQATDRAYRIGQRKNVLVHKFICRGTLEEKINTLIESKQGLANDLLDSSSEIKFTELNNQELLRLVSLDLHSAIR